MTEEMIYDLLSQYQKLVVQVNIIRDCSNSSLECIEENAKYKLLIKKVSLVDHWLDYLEEQEARVLQLHLIQGLSWNKISLLSDGGEIEYLPTDRRALQRLQNRAVKKIQAFTNCSFGHELDHLSE